MDEIDVLYFSADSWVCVKPETIQNSWDRTKFLNFKFNHRTRSIETDSAISTFELPLDDDLVNHLNEIIPGLPGNQTDDGTSSLMTGVEELEDFYANESNLIISLPDSVEFDEDDCNNQKSTKTLR